MRFKWIYFVIALLHISTALFAIEYTYAPGAGSDKLWNTAANWSPNGVPGSSDNVTIRDSVSVTSNVTVNHLTLSGNGKINSSATLTIRGVCTWTSGSLYGSGKVKFSSSATANIDGSNNKNMFRLTVENEGDIIWSGNGEIKLNRDARLINRSSGIIEIQNNSRMDYVQKTHGGYLTNYGTIRKTGSSGGNYLESQIDPILINEGTIEVDNGTLQIERGDSTTASNGDFEVAANCTLNIVDRPFHCDGADFSGNGVVQLMMYDTRPSLIVTGSGATFSSNTTLILNIDYNSPSDGFISGDGPVLINGDFIWDQGAIVGTGSFVVNGSTYFEGTVGTKILDQRTLTLNGNSTFSSTKSIVFRNAATLLNSAGATFTKTSTATWDSTSGTPTGTFQNDGTFIYENTGSMNFRVHIVNNGTLTVQSGGTIVFRNGLINAATGNLSGAGSLDIKKTFIHSGSISPGAPVGALHILGNITL